MEENTREHKIMDTMLLMKLTQAGAEHWPCGIAGFRASFTANPLADSFRAVVTRSSDKGQVARHDGLSRMPGLFLYRRG